MSSPEYSTHVRYNIRSILAKCMLLDVYLGSNDSIREWTFNKIRVDITLRLHNTRDNLFYQDYTVFVWNQERKIVLLMRSE